MKAKASWYWIAKFQVSRKNATALRTEVIVHMLMKGKIYWKQQLATTFPEATAAFSNAVCKAPSRLLC
jgi:hypothetical protein